MRSADDLPGMVLHIRSADNYLVAVSTTCLTLNLTDGLAFMDSENIFLGNASLWSGCECIFSFLSSRADAPWGAL